MPRVLAGSAGRERGRRADSIEITAFTCGSTRCVKSARSRPTPGAGQRRVDLSQRVGAEAVRGLQYDRLRLIEPIRHAQEQRFVTEAPAHAEQHIGLAPTVGAHQSCLAPQADSPGKLCKCCTKPTPEGGRGVIGAAPPRRGGGQAADGMEKIPSGPSNSLGSRRTRVAAQFFGASSMYRSAGQ